MALFLLECKEAFPSISELMASFANGTFLTEI